MLLSPRHNLSRTMHICEGMNSRCVCTLIDNKGISMDVYCIRLRLARDLTPYRWGTRVTSSGPGEERAPPSGSSGVREPSNKRERESDDEAKVTWKRGIRTTDQNTWWAAVIPRVRPRLSASPRLFCYSGPVIPRRARTLQLWSGVSSRQWRRWRR